MAISFTRPRAPKDFPGSPKAAREVFQLSLWKEELVGHKGLLGVAVCSLVAGSLGCNSNDSFAPANPVSPILAVAPTNGGTTPIPTSPGAPTTPPVAPSGGPSVVPLPTPTATSTNTVCNPLVSTAASSTVTPTNGVKGALYYFTSPAEITSLGLNPGALVVSNFFQSGHQADANLIFANFSAPPQGIGPGYPRQGFQMTNGQYIKLPDSSILYQYFAMQFSGQIQLPPGTPAASKQFAILSDDGSIVNINSGQIVLNNDGLRCSTINYGVASNAGANPTASLVAMTPGTPIPFTLQYFQGPAPGMALALYWRTVANPQSPGPLPAYPSYCGGEGDPLTLDIGGGWEVIPPEAFVLPGTTTNPCEIPTGNLSAGSQSVQ